MRCLLPFTALVVLVLFGTAWSEEDDNYAAERAKLQEQGQRLLEQGALDYQRLKQALTRIEAQKASLSASGGSLQAMDQLARTARMLDADITELQKARTRIEDARSQLRRGRFDAAMQAFNEAAARWSEVHQRIVSHIGEAPGAPTMPAATRPAPASIPAGGGNPSGELFALRQEIQAMRTELQALRMEVAELKALLQTLAR